MVTLEWDRVAATYRVLCDICSGDEEPQEIAEYCYRSSDGIHRAKYQPGEARTKAGAAWRRHVDKHNDRSGNSTRREHIARAVARQPKPLSGASQRALARFGIGPHEKIPIDPNDPPPF